MSEWIVMLPPECRERKQMSVLFIRAFPRSKSGHLRGGWCSVDADTKCHQGWTYEGGGSLPMPGADKARSRSALG